MPSMLSEFGAAKILLCKKENMRSIPSMKSCSTRVFVPYSLPAVWYNTSFGPHCNHEHTSVDVGSHITHLASRLS